jgi:hypothetical protein
MRTDRNGTGAPLSLAVDAAALRQLVAEVVRETLAQLEEIRATVPDRLAFSEPEAASLLGLNAWQLRDERLAGRVKASVGPGRRLLYSRQNLVEYLASRPWHANGTNGAR